MQKSSYMTNMDTPPKKVIIIIPLYRELTEMETISVERGIKILHKYPFNILHPESFCVTDLIQKYKGKADITETALPDKHFSSIHSYSDLLLTESFYNLYHEYEYMLIYQTDAYVFEDRLEEWLHKGYDFVGAPWIPSIYWYKKIVGVLHQKICKRLKCDIYNIPHCFKYFAVGNGGFSLRKIDTMRQIMADDKEIIKNCNYNEDWYISQVATTTHKLSIPNWKEALSFSFEHSLNHCYRLNGYQLPFGCHYWNTPKNYKTFWNRFIPNTK